MRFVVVLAALFAVFAFGAIACVDGTTPDCSTPASGCYPMDAAAGGDVMDSSDAASDADASPAVDAADGQADAADASLTD